MGSLARIFVACLVILVSALVFYRFRYPEVYQAEAEKRASLRVHSILGSLNLDDPEVAGANQEFLLSTFDQKGSNLGAAPIVRSGDIAKALVCFGRISHPKEDALRTLLAKQAISGNERKQMPFYPNSAILTTLGRIGPGAKVLLPELEQLPNQLGLKEAIQRISGKPPESFFLNDGLPRQYPPPTVNLPGMRGWTGNQSKIETERGEFISDQHTWDRSWKEHAGDTEKPTIDFSNRAVIAYFHGPTGSASGPWLESYEHSRSSVTVIIRVNYSDVISGFAEYPFLFFEIPKPAHQPIVLKRWSVAMGRPGKGEKELALFKRQ